MLNINSEIIDIARSIETNNDSTYMRLFWIYIKMNLSMKKSFMY